MRSSKRSLSFALVSCVSLLLTTACDLPSGLEKEEVEEGEAPAQEVNQEDPQIAKDEAPAAEEGTGVVYLRMADLSALPESGLSRLKELDASAQLTIEGISLRRCIPETEGGDEETTVRGERQREEIGSKKLPPRPEPTEDEGAKQEDDALQPKLPPKERPPLGDDSDAPEPAEDEGDDLRPPRPPKDGMERPHAPRPQGPEPDQVVERDEELAEEGDRPDSCAKAEWIEIRKEAVTLDLLDIDPSDAAALLADASLPAGRYRGLRILVSDAKLVIGGAEMPLRVPSGARSGIKIKAPFEVSDQGEVELNLGLDLRQALRESDKKGWMLRPVVRPKKQR